MTIGMADTAVTTAATVEITGVDTEGTVMEAMAMATAAATATVTVTTNTTAHCLVSRGG